jgi:hypothetical protein
MSRRFRFSLGWGIFGAVFGAAVGLGFCWFANVDGTTATLSFAILFGVLGSFFGDETIRLIFEFLSYL